MARAKRRRRVWDTGVRSRMVGLFLLSLGISFLIVTVGFIGYYLFSYATGENQYREFVVVYRQSEQIGTVTVDDRLVEQRGYSVEALPQITRLQLILPPLIINNILLAIALAVLAIRFSRRFAGPIYRIATDLRRALSGEHSVRIHLRKHDELRELAGRINALLDALERAERKAAE